MDEARETSPLVGKKVGGLELGGPRWKTENNHENFWVGK
jgi:hypothetical protein